MQCIWDLSPYLNALFKSEYCFDLNNFPSFLFLFSVIDLMQQTHFKFNADSNRSSAVSSIVLQKWNACIIRMWYKI